MAVPRQPLRSSEREREREPSTILTGDATEDSRSLQILLDTIAAVTANIDLDTVLRDIVDRSLQRLDQFAGVYETSIHAEAPLELALPFLPEYSRADDQEPPEVEAAPELGPDQPRLDRLPKTDLVGDEEPVRRGVE